jgi:hypothetical protein
VDGSAAIFASPEDISISVFGVDPAAFRLSFAANGFSGTFTGGGTTSAVPLPAGLPLLLTALGAVGLIARRRRAPAA